MKKSEFATFRLQVSLAVLSSLLLALAYPGFNMSYLAWVALVPLFFALEKRKPKERFLIGYVFGLVFFSCILYWLFNVTIPGTIVLVLLLALQGGIFSSLSAFAELPACREGRLPRSATADKYFASAIHRLLSVAFVPAAWVFTEYLRSHLLTGFPWALLGYSQSANLPVIQIADITGAYGVSFLIVLLNFTIFLALKKSPKRFYILFFVFVLFSLVFIYGQNRIGHLYPFQKLDVSVIQGNIPQDEKWNPNLREAILSKYENLTKESLKDRPQLVIWPETSLPGYLGERDLKRRITELAGRNNIFLLVGALREDKEKIFNSASLISDSGTILGTYDKIHLVPFGEFIPFGKALSTLRGFINKPIGDFERGNDFKVFRIKLRTEVRDPESIRKAIEFHSFSVLICFEDIFPGLSRQFVKNGAKFLVNITNDAWFGKTAAPYQHTQGSVFRAVENRVPVLRAANTGVSCIIDHTGKIVALVKKDNKETFVDGYASAIIEPVSAETIYTRFGDVFSWICILFVFIGLILAKKKGA